MIDQPLVILKIKFLVGWACQILGREKWKNRIKWKNAQFYRALKGDLFSFVSEW